MTQTVGYTWGRTIINLINMVLCITILVCIIYVCINYKKIFTKAIGGILEAVNENRSNIQTSINKFAEKTTVSTLNNENVKNQIVTTAVSTLNNENVKNQIVTTANETITSP